MTEKIQDENENLHIFLSNEKSAMEDMLQNGLDIANQACRDTDEKLRNDLSQMSNKIQDNMDKVNCKINEQKNDASVR